MAGGLIGVGAVRYDHVRDPIPRWRRLTAELRLPSAFGRPSAGHWDIRNEPAYVRHWRIGDRLDRACEAATPALRAWVGPSLVVQDDPPQGDTPRDASLKNTQLCFITALPGHDWLAAEFEYDGKGNNQDHRAANERMATGFTLTWRLRPKSIGWLG
jgi:hypothetical protein